jgi:hypothetical protein
VTTTADNVESFAPERMIPGIAAPAKALTVIPLANVVVAAERWLCHADRRPPSRAIAQEGASTTRTIVFAA